MEHVVRHHHVVLAEDSIPQVSAKGLPVAPVPDQGNLNGRHGPPVPRQSLRNQTRNQQETPKRTTDDLNANGIRCQREANILIQNLRRWDMIFRLSDLHASLARNKHVSPSEGLGSNVHVQSGVVARERGG